MLPPGVSTEKERCCDHVVLSALPLLVPCFSSFPQNPLGAYSKFFHTDVSGRWAGTWSELVTAGSAVTWPWCMVCLRSRLLPECFGDFGVKQGLLSCCSSSFSSSQMCVTFCSILLFQSNFLVVPTWKDVNRRASLPCDCLPFSNLHKCMVDENTSMLWVSVISHDHVLYFLREPGQIIACAVASLEQ